MKARPGDQVVLVTDVRVELGDDKRTAHYRVSFAGHGPPEHGGLLHTLLRSNHFARLRA